MPKAFVGAALAATALILPASCLRADEASPSSLRGAGPGLQRFIHTLASSNPEVRAAHAALVASGAMRDAASRPLYNPEVDTEIQRSADDPKTIAISQTLDWAGKRAARLDAAERERLVSQARYTLTIWSVSTELLAGLAGYHTAVAREELAEHTARTAAEFEALAERRFEAGDLTQVDLSLARLLATDARIQRARRSGERAAALQVMRALAVDLPPRTWPALPDPPTELPVSTLVPDDLVHRLPEVVAAQREVDLAEARVTVRRKARRPDPTLSLTGGRDAEESLIGLTVSMPLFVRNRFDNEVRAALARHDEARFSSDAVLRRARARLVSAGERFELLSAAWIEWQRGGRPSLDLQIDQLRRIWQAGELSTTDYLVQVTQTFAVRDNALELRLALWDSWFEWLRASGQIDDWLALDAIAAERGRDGS